jgi:hypothetical protein
MKYKFCAGIILELLMLISTSGIGQHRDDLMYPGDLAYLKEGYTKVYLHKGPGEECAIIDSIANREYFYIESDTLNWYVTDIAFPCRDTINNYTTGFKPVYINSCHGCIKKKYVQRVKDLPDSSEREELIKIFKRYNDISKEYSNAHNKTDSSTLDFKYGNYGYAIASAFSLFRSCYMKTGDTLLLQDYFISLSQQVFIPEKEINSIVLGDCFKKAPYVFLRRLATINNVKKIEVIKELTDFNLRQLPGKYTKYREILNAEFLRSSKDK